MKHRIGAWLVRLGCLCILVSLVFLTHNIREEQQVEQATDTALTGVQQAIADGEGEAETVTVDGEQYLGYLSIPDLNLTLPILSTWDFNRLKIAPCRYSGSLTDGKLVIAAHNYVRHFAKLYTLKKGLPHRLYRYSRSRISLHGASNPTIKADRRRTHGFRRLGFNLVYLHISRKFACCCSLYTRKIINREVENEIA